MAARTAPHFPFAALERFVRRDSTIDSERSLALALGVHDTTLARFRRDGVAAWFADRICAGLNVHPLEIWPDEYDEWVPVKKTRTYDREKRREIQARYRAKVKARSAA